MSNRSVFIFTEVVILADESVKGMEMEGAKWIFLMENMGFSDVKTGLENREWDIGEPKVLILITGRAEAAIPHPAILNVVRNTLSVIKKILPNTVVLMCAAVPSVKDGQFVLAELEGLADILHRECKESEYFEYSRLGTYLYGKKRAFDRHENPSRDAGENVYLLKRKYMNIHGFTDEGLKMLSNRLKDKVHSAKLLDRFELLLAKQRLIDI